MSGTPEDGYIFAYTPGQGDGEWKHYPPFINVSRKDGRIVVIVRGIENTSGEHPDVGAWAEMVLPDEEARKLADALGDNT